MWFITCIVLEGYTENITLTTEYNLPNLLNSKHQLLYGV